MTFEHAQVTKGLMILIALTSIGAGIFDIKHFLHLQLVPHISKHHQYWRLLAHQLVCASSGDLLLTELLLYNASIHIERAFGSVKYASFILISLMLNTLSTFVTQLILHILPVVGPVSNQIPPGPVAVLFGIVYQYLRLIPSAYEFKIFGIPLSDKVWTYAVAVQLAFAHAPASWIPAFVGFFVGYAYRSDVFQLKGWRVPYRMVALSQQWIRPILGTETPLRRNNRVFPESRTRPRNGAAALAQDEVITTARPAPATTATQRNRPAEAGSPETQQSPTSTTGVVRQWVTELADAARPGTRGQGTVRAPSNDEIQTLTTMFPDVPRDVILGVLQRSATIEAAAETLLSTSH